MLHWLTFRTLSTDCWFRSPGLMHFKTFTWFRLLWPLWLFRDVLHKRDLNVDDTKRVKKICFITEQGPFYSFLPKKICCTRRSLHKGLSTEGNERESVCVCLWLCVCKKERERERERERKSEREKEWERERESVKSAVAKAKQRERETFVLRRQSQEKILAHSGRVGPIQLR